MLTPLNQNYHIVTWIMVVLFSVEFSFMYTIALVLLVLIQPKTLLTQQFAVDLRSIQNYFGGWWRGQWPCHSVWVPPFLLSSMCGPDLTTIVELGSVLNTCMHFFFALRTLEVVMQDIPQGEIPKNSQSRSWIRMHPNICSQFAFIFCFVRLLIAEVFALTGCRRFTGSFGTFG